MCQSVLLMTYCILIMQDIGTASVTGVDGAFVPPTKGTSQALVSNTTLLLLSHLLVVLALISMA